MPYNALWNAIRLAPLLLAVYLLSIGAGRKRWCVLMLLCAVQAALALAEGLVARFDTSLFPYLSALSLYSAGVAALCAYRYVTPQPGRETKPLGLLYSVGIAGAICCTGLSFALVLAALFLALLLAGMHYAKTAAPTWRATVRTLALPLALGGALGAFLLEMLARFSEIEAAGLSLLGIFAVHGVATGLALWAIAAGYAALAPGYRFAKE